MVKQTSFRTIIIGIETTTEFFGGREIELDFEHSREKWGFTPKEQCGGSRREFTMKKDQRVLAKPT